MKKQKLLTLRKPHRKHALLGQVLIYSTVFLLLCYFFYESIPQQNGQLENNRILEDCSSCNWEPGFDESRCKTIQSNKNNMFKYPNQTSFINACKAENNGNGCSVEYTVTEFGVINGKCVLCLEPGVYPTEALNFEQRQNGGFILYFIGVLYMFTALALVCDDYFVPSLDVIIEKFKISPDVAGATFMAAGGSAPELFTSIMGVFVAESASVGFGTIIGSAVFNVLFVIGFCAWFAPGILTLTTWPFLRDCTFYSIDLIILAVFFHDDKIEFYETVILLILYAAYVTFMKFNETAKAWYYKTKTHIEKDDKEQSNNQLVDNPQSNHNNNNNFNQTNGGADNLVAEQQNNNLNVKLDDANQQSYNEDHVSLKDNADQERNKINQNQEQSNKENEEEEGAGDEDAEDDGAIDMSWPKGKKDQCTYLFLFPITIFLYLTIPDCHKEKNKKYFVFSFIMSLVWIGVYSYLMIWWAVRLGQALRIDDVIMGLTLLAAGTSVPDLLTSIIVTKKGEGDMAVSSSIGSNIFDVTMGLPIPWFFKTLITQEYYCVSSGDTIVSVLVLFAMLLVVLFTFIYFKWRLYKPIFYVMVFLYMLFMVQAILIAYL